MNENATQPIGEPQPIEPRLGWVILKGMAAGISVSLGGFLIFAGLLAPTRLTGASRSARLKWQTRQKEIQERIDHDRQAPAEVAKPRRPEKTADPNS